MDPTWNEWYNARKNAGLYATVSRQRGRRKLQAQFKRWISFHSDFLDEIRSAFSRAPNSFSAFRPNADGVFGGRSRSGEEFADQHVDVLASVTAVHLNFISNENSDKCQLLNTICSCLFVLRTYALWDNNKIVLATMVTTFLAVVISSTSFAFATTANAPCLMCLTLIRAIQNWRSTNGNLYAVLVKHNIFYYACGLCFSAVNILTLQLFQYGYQAMFQEYAFLSCCKLFLTAPTNTYLPTYTFQFIVLAILATRMHLHLWHTDRHTYDSSALSDVMSALLQHSWYGV
ncbi:hypothetical protein BDR03DRAFT_987014 [Suillus americanus]|nr:hypothetical protein BDR03DRAFT_987014 [Suillus americanus]